MEPGPGCTSRKILRKPATPGMPCHRPPGERGRRSVKGSRLTVTRVSCSLLMMVSPSAQRGGAVRGKSRPGPQPPDARQDSLRDFPLHYQRSHRSSRSTPLGTGPTAATVANPTVGIDMLQSHVECQRERRCAMRGLRQQQPPLHGGEHGGGKIARTR